jgi:hypothetical protein
MKDRQTVDLLCS